MNAQQLSLALPTSRVALSVSLALPTSRVALSVSYVFNMYIYIYLCILIFATPAAGVAVLFIIHLLNFLATSFDILGITPDPCEASKNMPTLSEQAL